MPDSVVQAWNFLGMCQVSMGDLRQGAAMYERVLRSDPACLEAWVHLAQARKEVRTTSSLETSLHQLIPAKVKRLACPTQRHTACCKVC